jgi:hypothetical protein
MKEIKLYLLVELLWWAVTGVVVLAVMWPIWSAGVIWLFQTPNIFFIVTLITFGRHIFALNSSLIGKKQILKAFILIALVPIVFAFISHLNEFMVYVEEHMWDQMTGHLEISTKRKIESYLYNEMLFFSVGSILASFGLAARLIMSLWKQYNSEQHKNYQHR